MACQTFWELYWQYKTANVPQADALQAAIQHFDGCLICQSHAHPDDRNTSQHQDECAACRAIAQADAAKGG